MVFSGSVTQAINGNTSTDTVSLLRKGLQLSERPPPDWHAREKEFFLRQLSQMV